MNPDDATLTRELGKGTAVRCRCIYLSPGEDCDRIRSVCEKCRPTSAIYEVFDYGTFESGKHTPPASSPTQQSTNTVGSFQTLEHESTTNHRFKIASVTRKTTRHLCFGQVYGAITPKTLRHCLHPWYPQSIGALRIPVLSAVPIALHAPKPHYNW